MRAFANSTAQRDEGIGARPRGRSTWVRTGAVVPLLLVAACGPGKSVYVYRSDATVAEADKVVFDCRVAAARNVPSDTQVYSTPAWSTPVYTDCASNRGRTSCVTSGGFTMGGDVHSYDANSGLRAEYFRRCVEAPRFTPRRSGAGPGPTRVYWCERFRGLAGIGSGP